MDTATNTGAKRGRRPSVPLTLADISKLPQATQDALAALPSDELRLVVLSGMKQPKSTAPTSSPAANAEKIAARIAILDEQVLPALQAYRKALMESKKAAVKGEATDLRKVLAPPSVENVFSVTFNRKKDGSEVEDAAEGTETETGEGEGAGSEKELVTA